MPADVTPWLLIGLPILFVVVLFLLAWLIASGKSDMRRQVARLGHARRAGSFDTFAADFPPGHEPEILRAVYDSFQRAAASHQGVDGFVVRADDVLEVVYDARLVDDYNDLDDLDLRAVVGEAARACNRRLVEPDAVRVPVRLKTVRDVVMFLARCPRVADSGERSSR